jgi:hypothetical protein
MPLKRQVATWCLHEFSPTIRALLSPPFFIRRIADEMLENLTSRKVKTRLY